MHVLLISALNLNFSICFADDLDDLYAKENKSFQYFRGRDIDYWNEGKRVRQNHFRTDSRLSKSASFSGSNTIRSSDAMPFSWTNYQDPKRAEFWDDGGDWIPPRPFREAVANPTKENIDGYLNWMSHKTEVIERFQKALSDFSKSGVIEDNAVANDVNWNNFQIVYVYQTGCQHCRNSIQTIETAKRLGATVTFVQLDSKQNPPLHANSISYEDILHLLKQEASNISNEILDLVTQVTATPTWILQSKNRDSNRDNHPTQLTGAISFSELSHVAKQLSQKGAIQ